MERIEHAVVVGGGSAGLLMALTLQRQLKGLRVTVLHSPDVPIIGVGEGTLFSMPIYLHGFLGISPAAFHEAVRPTYKLGIRFLWGSRPYFHYTFSPQVNWHLDKLPRPKGFYCDEDFSYASAHAAMMASDRAFERNPDGTPLITKTHAYHVENRPFVDFLHRVARERGIEFVEDTVVDVGVADGRVTSLQLASGQAVEADFYVDASGFRSLLLGQALEEPYVSFASSLFCDRAVVGGWARTGEPLRAHTTAETMDAGWCWQIEHERYINRGYVYSSAFLDDEAAEAEFRQKNPKVESTRVVRFRSGRYQRPWVGNVLAVGNAVGFVEPMEATALHLICNSGIELVRSLRDADRRLCAPVIELFNRNMAAQWDSVRRFLAVHYKYNKRLDTPFWQACREDTDLAGAEEYIDFYRSVGPSIHGSQLLGPEEQFGVEGYLTMLLGQQVPHDSAYRVSKRERRAWRAIKQGYLQRAHASMTQEQGLKVIRGPSFQWRESFYRDLANWR